MSEQQNESEPQGAAGPQGAIGHVGPPLPFGLDVSSPSFRPVRNLLEKSLQNGTETFAGAYDFAAKLGLREFIDACRDSTVRDSSDQDRVMSVFANWVNRDRDALVEDLLDSVPEADFRLSVDTINTAFLLQDSEKNGDRDPDETCPCVEFFSCRGYQGIQFSPTTIVITGEDTPKSHWTEADAAEFLTQYAIAMLRAVRPEALVPELRPRSE